MRGWVDAGDDVLYSSTLICEGSNPMSVGVALSAESSAGHTLNVTVRNYLSAVSLKLGAPNRHAAAEIARSKGILLKEYQGY